MKYFLLATFSLILFSACQKQVNYAPDISTLSDKLAQLQFRSDSLSAALNATNNNLNNTNNIVNNLTKSIDSLKTQLLYISTQINTINNQLSAVNADINLLKAQLATLTQQYTDILNMLNKIIAQLNTTPASLSSGLVAWYPFSGNAYDSSVYGNHGTVVGASLTTDRFNKSNTAYNFNGSAYISIPNTSQLNFGNSSFAMSCWVLCTGSSQWQHIITKGDIPYPNKEFYLRYDQNSIDFTSTLGATESGIYTRCRVQVADKQNWHQIVVNYNSTQGISYLYFDGDLVVQNQIISNLTNTTGPMYIGVENPIVSLPSGPQYFTGKIDDIRLYNRILSNSEINFLATH